MKAIHQYEALQWAYLIINRSETPGKCLQEMLLEIAKFGEQPFHELNKILLDEQIAV